MPQKKTSKTSTLVPDANVVDTPPEKSAAATVADETETETDSSFDTRFKELLEIASTQQSNLKVLVLSIKQLQKDVNKMERSKRRKGKTVNNGDKPKREPSGFAKPALISDAMAKFLGEKKGISLARTDVTKRISQYIKKHNLQNPANKREIFPNKELRSLLHVPQADLLTFFNLQKYLKIHFTSVKSS